MVLNKILRSICDRALRPSIDKVESRLANIERVLEGLSSADRELTLKLDEQLLIMRFIDERSQSLHMQGQNLTEMVSQISTSVESLTGGIKGSFLYVDERIQSVMHQTNELKMAGERIARDISESLTYIDGRTRSILYQTDELTMTGDFELDFIRRFYLETKLSNQAPNIPDVPLLNLRSDHVLAIDSPDHMMPESTVEGLSRPTPFATHIVEILGRDITVLDLGTGAAGFVFELQQKGLSAYGIDGSDYCRLNDIGYWPILNRYLFTCDITKPFSFSDCATNNSQRFRLITAWEVLEHIPAEGLSALFNNVVSNLSDDGYFVGSVSLLEYVASNGTPYHVSIFPKEKWAELFSAHGLQMVDNSPFNTRLFCRGNGPRFQDRHNYFLSPEDGFHFVAVKKS
jgi:Methyltransferase domain